MKSRAVRALTFDVFGTVVDWRGTIVREGKTLGEARGIRADWLAVAERWRQKYAMAAAGGGLWRPLDQVLRQAGAEVLDEFHIVGLTDADRERWVDVWARLDPWPDAVPGLTKLRNRHLLVALSNANTALSITLANHARLPWDQVLGTDVVQAYKPDPRVYCMALRRLNLDGPQVMMVAAHLFDLRGAKALGFKTAFIRRAGEEAGDPRGAPYVDVVADDLVELAGLI
jgi:2-haloacid dehalogenase